MYIWYCRKRLSCLTFIICYETYYMPAFAFKAAYYKYDYQPGNIYHTRLIHCYEAYSIYGCKQGSTGLHRFLWSILYIRLPAGEEPTEVLWVACLLYKMCDLSSAAQLNSILDALQLLLQPQQHALRHLVNVGLTVAWQQNIKWC